METSALVPLEYIQSRILVLRGHRVVLDRDLALLSGVAPKRLLEQMRRNRDRSPVTLFPVGTQRAYQLEVAFCDLKRGHGGRRYAPFVFTEHGALMVANVLDSPAALAMSVHVVRAFVHLRQTMVNHKALSSKLAELEARLGAHDEQLASIVEAIRLLTTPDEPTHGRKMGFHQGNR